MRISRVDVVVTNPGQMRYGNYVLVRITTDDGVHGWGDASLAGRELPVASLLRDHYSQLLIGRSALDTEDIWQLLTRGGYWRGGPVMASAVAGVDMALWDIKGKVAGLPVYQLLGGRCRSGALVYGHAGGFEFAEVADHAERLRDLGYKVVRMQVAIPGMRNTYGTAATASRPEDEWPPMPAGVPDETFEPGAYLRRIPAMFDYLRGKLGDELEMCHDTHERVNPIQAARLARDLEPYKLFFLEDLLPPHHDTAWRQIRAASTTPLAMGELWNDLADGLPLIREQLIDFVRYDLAHSGGITAARKIAATADAFGIRTAWHGPSDISPITHAANVHVDVAIPNFGVQEYAAHLQSVTDVISGGPVFRDGYLDVDERPGLGTDVDLEAALAHPYVPTAIPIARRADGSMHDW